jgi:hypothetical protein
MYRRRPVQQGRLEIGRDAILDSFSGSRSTSSGQALRIQSKAIVGLRPSFSAHVRSGERGAPDRFPKALLHATHFHARTGSLIVRRSVKGPAAKKKLDSSAVICCADTIPGMREEIVLGAVIELVTRTQLATDVETQSGNSDSN